MNARARRLRTGRILVVAVTLASLAAHAQEAAPPVLVVPVPPGGVEGAPAPPPTDAPPPTTEKPPTTVAPPSPVAPPPAIVPTPSTSPPAAQSGPLTRKEVGKRTWSALAGRLIGLPLAACGGACIGIGALSMFNSLAWYEAARRDAIAVPERSLSEQSNIAGISMLGGGLVFLVVGIPVLLGGEVALLWGAFSDADLALTAGSRGDGLEQIIGWARLALYEATGQTIAAGASGVAGGGVAALVGTILLATGGYDAADYVNQRAALNQLVGTGIPCALGGAACAGLAAVLCGSAIGTEAAGVFLAPTEEIPTSATKATAVRY